MPREREEVLERRRNHLHLARVLIEPSEQRLLLFVVEGRRILDDERAALLRRRILLSVVRPFRDRLSERWSQKREGGLN